MKHGFLQVYKIKRTKSLEINTSVPPQKLRTQVGTEMGYYSAFTPACFLITIETICSGLSCLTSVAINFWMRSPARDILYTIVNIFLLSFSVSQNVPASLLSSQETVLSAAPASDNLGPSITDALANEELAATMELIKGIHVPLFKIAKYDDL